MNTCPEWCTTDHETPQFSDGSGFTVHSGARTVIQPAGQVARISVYPSRTTTGPVEVSVHATAYGHPMRDGYLTPGDPEALALTVELLANATPEQHRQVADAIRQAAALETEREPEAGA